MKNKSIGLGSTRLLGVDGDQIDLRIAMVGDNINIEINSGDSKITALIEDESDILDLVSLLESALHFV